LLKFKNTEVWTVTGLVFRPTVLIVLAEGLEIFGLRPVGTAEIRFPQVICMRNDILTAVWLTYHVIWDFKPCRSYRRFESTTTVRSISHYKYRDGVYHRQDRYLYRIRIFHACATSSQKFNYW
jgi:hypothetical protein